MTLIRIGWNFRCVHKLFSTIVLRNLPPNSRRVNQGFKTIDFLAKAELKKKKRIKVWENAQHFVMDSLKLLWLDQLLENSLICSSLHVSTPTPRSCTSTAIHTPTGGIWPPTLSTHHSISTPCHSHHIAPRMNRQQHTRLPRSVLGLRCFRSLCVFCCLAPPHSPPKTHSSSSSTRRWDAALPLLSLSFTLSLSLW